MSYARPSKFNFKGQSIKIVVLLSILFFSLPSGKIQAQVAWSIRSLDSTVTASSTNPQYATQVISFPSEIIGHSFDSERYVKILPTNNNYYARTSGQQCFPLNGGSGAFLATSSVALTPANQTSNTALGAVACNSTGNYYQIYRDVTASSTILYVATYFYDSATQEFSAIDIPQTESTSTPTIPTPKNIEILDPIYGTTTATTTFIYRIHFSTPFSIDFRPTTTRTVIIRDAVTGEQNYISTTTLGANSSENLIVIRTATTSIGSKYISAFYTDINGKVYSEVDEVFFNVATNTYFLATGLLTPLENPSNLTQINCGLFEFGCQFQKALTFLFVPSDTILDKFSNLWQNIAEKKPFGYVTHTITQLSQLNTSGTPAFDLGTIPFMDSIFTPFRTLIASILWALFAVYFYKNRLIHLDI